MELELKEYFRIISKRWWLIACIVLLSSVTTGIFSIFFVQPQYAASAKMIVNKSTERQGVQLIDAGTINASIMLINTYKEIIKSPAIMDKVVAKHPEIELSADQLGKRISATSVNDSQVITLQVVDRSYSRAMNIVNAVSEVFKDEIPTIMSVDNVAILNNAKEINNPVPVNRSPLINILISAFVALVVSLGIVFLIEYLDDTIKTEKDVETYLGIPALVTISRIKSTSANTNSNKKSQRMVGESANVSVNS
ncbi:YveK family protein [Paenibacillus sp. GCM10027628]|uniref:YveK family protein n=1 Tax=Paenibacillus sp. GCM10027628 TaxID=3273413 RepID=UPI003632BBC5